MGVHQQACVLLLHHGGLRGTGHAGYRTAVSEVLGQRADP
jgi:hypothetical protein